MKQLTIAQLMKQKHAPHPRMAKFMEVVKWMDWPVNPTQPEPPDDVPLGAHWYVCAMTELIDEIGICRFMYALSIAATSVGHGFEEGSDEYEIWEGFGKHLFATAKQTALLPQQEDGEQ